MKRFGDRITDNMALRKRSLIHIELLRVIAIYLVMFTHTGGYGYFLFSISQESKLYPLYLFMSVACKPAVPLFFMISGALLLGKSESIRELYQHRILKFVVVLAVISVLYHVYNWYFAGTELDWQECFTTFYSSKASVALWYLYSYIGVLMMLPLLRKMVQGMKREDYLYMAVCQIVITGIIPIVQYLVSNGTVTLSDYFSAALFTESNLFFFVMGYYFEQLLDESAYTGRNALLAVGMALLAIIITCVMTWYKIRLTGDASQSNAQTFYHSLEAVSTFSIYFLVKYFVLRVQLPVGVQRAIQFIGGTTFGIYLLEGILRDRTQDVFFALRPVVGTMPACLIWIFVAYLCGIVVVALLKKVPILKKFL